MTATLLDERVRQGQVYSGGWTSAHGGDVPIVEPATGDELGRAGSADAADVDRACAARGGGPARVGGDAVRGAGGRPAPGRRPHRGERRRHAALDDPRDRRGPGHGRRSRPTWPAQECYEAAALASRPVGEILQTAQPRLSLLKRVPVGVVGVISPFNVPLILSIRSVAPALALGNAVVLKPDPRTRGQRRLHRSPGSSRRPACPRVCCTCCPAAPTSGTALVADPGYG